MGLVGAGFVGPHHVDAVRRLGYVDVVAVAGSSKASAQAKADALHVGKAYGSYQELLDDPAVQVVHNATPNFLHHEVTAAAIARGKHVVSDKPLPMTAARYARTIGLMVLGVFFPPDISRQNLSDDQSQTIIVRTITSPFSERDGL